MHAAVERQGTPWGAFPAGTAPLCEKKKMNHQRKPNRMPGYDYFSQGAYFITICSNGMLHLFGSIVDGTMVCNDAGLMMRQKWLEMQRYYPGISTEALCVMPNHLHAIVRLTGEKEPIWLPGTPRGAFPTGESATAAGTPRGAFPTLGIPEYMDRYKSLTTRLYINGVRKGNYLPFYEKVWQKSYYDHVVRDEYEYRRIFCYIKTNPKRWKHDLFYVSDK